ncbi:MAG: hypothetical protein J5654_12340 [Victivallales bacterium]|nr:hypothetical protein [Victivallales bacterium]
MLTFLGKCADALTSMDDDAERVVNNYIRMLQRGILATRIAMAVLATGLVIYMIVQVFRIIRKRRKQK